MVFDKCKSDLLPCPLSPLYTYSFEGNKPNLLRRRRLHATYIQTWLLIADS